MLQKSRNSCSLTVRHIIYYLLKSSFSSHHFDLFERQAKICSVSASWREAAISDERLWCGVGAYLDECNYPPVPLLKLYADRSGDMLIDFTLGPLVEPDTTFPNKHTRERRTSYHSGVLGIILSTVGRWRSFTTRQHDGWWPSLDLLMNIPFEQANCLINVEVHHKYHPKPVSDGEVGMTFAQICTSLSPSIRQFV
jgi:hypothetical protein